MTTDDAYLIDSNVIVAFLAEAHVHHRPSRDFITTTDSSSLTVAAHSMAEAYVTLTRTGPAAQFGFTPMQVQAGLRAVQAGVRVVGLAPGSTFDAVMRYADLGGIGARLYDALIGETAIVNGIETVVTWNKRHFTGLFPRLTVLTPADWLAR